MQTISLVAIRFPGCRTAKVRAALDALGNPPGYPIARALESAECVHFMSMSVVHEAEEPDAYLVLELCADGGEDAALRRVALTIPDALLQVLRAAGKNVAPASLGVFLEQHRLKVGPAWLRRSGVIFRGTQGLSAPRIKREARFAAWAADWLDRHPRSDSALAALNEAREEAFKQVDLKWALDPEPPPAPPPSDTRAAFTLALARDLLWPLAIPPVLAALYAAFIAHAPLRLTAAVFLIALVATIVVAAIIIAAVFATVLWQERLPSPDLAPLADHVAQIMSRENAFLQNHVVGVSTLKPGRRLVLRAMFWLVEHRAKHSPRPGFLSDIGTIHFASWTVLPRKRASGPSRLLFLSNYDGSWLSYLEDFIAQAHQGLTSIWSNTRDFPKTKLLTRGGAHDAERFKRWSRRQQQPTRFWYSAYPNLSTARIRTNAAIRHGFATAATNDEAAQWLSCLGFPPQAAEAQSQAVAAPAGKPRKVAVHPNQVLETSDVSTPHDQFPALVFGGLPHLRYSHCLLVQLSAAPGAAKAWLRGIERKVAHGKGHQDGPLATVVGFTHSGLMKLGTPPGALAMFPSAFQHGMDAPWRARMLGDVGPNAPRHWWWGAEDKRCDVLVLLYATNTHELAQAVRHHSTALADRGHAIVQQVALKPLPAASGVREPFGFIDGVSQPYVRELRKPQAAESSLHTIALGEIVLGHPDNRRYVAPTPRCEPNVDLGGNGSFLVVRQLEQDPAAFVRYVANAAAELSAAHTRDPRVPTNDVASLYEWIAAKMVGRWKSDGSSLVNHPSAPSGNGKPDNDFRFGDQDRFGLRCPYSAHIRRANPRDSLGDNSAQQLEFANEHRVLRVGRVYEPSAGAEKPGLLFMCVNADIESQFEFLQQTWVLGRSFHGLNDEIDYVVGACEDGRCVTMSIPTPHGPLRLKRLRDFVTVRGGAYFFMPSQSALEFLATSNS